MRRTFLVSTTCFLNKFVLLSHKYLLHLQGFHGVMVSTQDSESCDPSSNLGGTLNIFKSYFLDLNLFIWHYFEICFIRGRDSSVGRALD